MFEAENRLVEQGCCPNAGGDVFGTMSRREFVKTAAVVASGLVAAPAMASLAPTAPVGLPLRFGVNYIPRKNWLFCWDDWDRQAVADDFDAIRSLGMDHLRVHCMWPLFQPGMNYVSERMLDQMGQLMELADQRDLDVEVTVLDGWMSGDAYLPAWTLANESRHRNIFTTPDVIEGEKLLFTKLAGVVGKHRRFMGFDLGNELSTLLRTGNPATVEEGTAWLKETFAHVEQLAPGKFHVNGHDHTVWWTDIAFTRTVSANTGSATIVHSYPFFSGALARYGYSGIGTLHLVEYNAAFAYAYQTNLARGVWVEEVGVTAEWMPESYMPEYAQHVIENAVDTGILWGITWWCSHDISPELSGFKSLEYKLGLIDDKNRVKPFGKALADTARQVRGKTFSPTQRKTALVVPDSGLGKDPDWTYATAYMNLLKARKKPCIVIESYSHDEDYLRARGITELIPLADVAKV